MVTSRCCWPKPFSVYLLFCCMGLPCQGQEGPRQGHAENKVDRRLSAALATLERHNIQPSFDGVRLFLESLEPEHPVQVRIAQQALRYVNDLKSADYQTRQQATIALTRMPIRPVNRLQETAQSKELEVAYRAKSILRYAELRDRRDTYEGIVEAASVMIEVKQFKGMIPTLLANIDRFDDVATRKALREAVVATSRKSDEALLRVAMKSELSDTRIAGLTALARINGPVSSRDVLEMLERENDEHVQLAAARVLGDMGIRESLPLLLELLESDKITVRLESHRLLLALTNQQIQFVAYDPKENRDLAVKRWRQWIEEAGATAELRFPVVEVDNFVGRILYSDYKRDKVFEVDLESNAVWSMDFPSAWSVQGLANGNRLILSYSQKYAAEFDPSGKEVWRLDNLPGEALGMQRLDNGNTLFSCGHKVIEYRRDKTIVWEVDLGKRTAGVQRLDSGNTLVALYDANSIVEVDQEGKVVWSIQELDHPIEVQRTESGTTLVAANTGGAAREYDRQGNVVWEFEHGGTNSVNRRLPNGDTLIGCRNKIMLVAPDKTVRWEISGLEHCYGMTAY